MNENTLLKYVNELVGNGQSFKLDPSCHFPNFNIRGGPSVGNT
jgi:hypothetical protein